MSEPMESGNAPDDLLAFLRRRANGRPGQASGSTSYIPNGTYEVLPTADAVVPPGDERALVALIDKGAVCMDHFFPETWTRLATAGRVREISPGLFEPTALGRFEVDREDTIPRDEEILVIFEWWPKEREVIGTAVGRQLFRLRLAPAASFWETWREQAERMLNLFDWQVTSQWSPLDAPESGRTARWAALGRPAA